MAKKARELSFDQRAKRLASQRKKIRKTVRLFAKQLSDHLAEVEDLLLDTSGAASVMLQSLTKRRTKAALVAGRAAAAPPAEPAEADGKKSMFGKNETWAQVLPKLRKSPAVDPRRAV